MGGKARPGTGLRDKRIPPGETIADINRVSRAFGRSDEHGSARRPRRRCRKTAHRFAGAFPMPAEALRAEMGVRRSSIGWSELFDLKQLFGVSVQAARFRRGAAPRPVPEMCTRLRSRRQEARRRWPRLPTAAISGDTSPTSMSPFPSSGARSPRFGSIVPGEFQSDVVVHFDAHRDPRASNLIWCRGWGSNMNRNSLISFGFCCLESNSSQRSDQRDPAV